MSEKAVMPEEPYYGDAEYFSPDCIVVDKINYDALRAYATALREENERLKQIIGAFALQAQALGIKELTLSIDAAKGDGNG